MIPERSFIRLLWHYMRAFIAALINGFPARKLTIIGITGTDGKTTTVNMATHILKESGIKVGAISTAFLQINDDIDWNETQKTSPSPFLIQSFLRRLAKEGCTHAVLEISSHGLVQGRVNHIYPKVAAITNTSMEHLDYHGTIEQYRKDKDKLFKMLKGNGTKVLNADDETFLNYSKIESDKTICFSNGKRKVDSTSSPQVESGKYDSTISLSDIKTSHASSSAILNIEDDKFSTFHFPLSISLPGSFNLENALCSISCAYAVGVSIEKSTEALKTFKGSPGRMELIDEGQSFSVYVDFTVTPAAYEKTLSTLRQMISPDKRILVLTGSCGDRMKEKRPIVGKLCSELADVVVVTNEDPYTEDPEKIIDEVWTGIDQSQCKAHRIFDRKEAIKFIFDNAQAGDAVILCAKGSDTTMWTKEGQIPWNEREIARELLMTIDN